MKTQKHENINIKIKKIRAYSSAISVGYRLKILLVHMLQIGDILCFVFCQILSSSPSINKWQIELR